MRRGHAWSSLSGQTLPFPVLVDVDIGHRPPQLTLLNGLPAVVRFGEGGGSVAQVIPST